MPLFADIEPAKLKLLAFMSERVGFDHGKFLCHQGDQADAAYLIIEGEAEILLEGPAGPVIVAAPCAHAIARRTAIPGDVPPNPAGRAPGRPGAPPIPHDPPTP